MSEHHCKFNLHSEELRGATVFYCHVCGKMVNVNGEDPTIAPKEDVFRYGAPKLEIAGIKA